MAGAASPTGARTAAGRAARPFVKPERGPGTRDAILDASEAIMREEGYAAVTSRRVAERAGLKSQLVHYHFGTMDELFLALLDRAEATYLAAQEEALAAPAPITALWQLSRGGDIALTLELVAAANHRKLLRRQLARSLERVRGAQVAAIDRALPTTNAAGQDPAVIAFLIAAVSRALASEINIGASDGHDRIVGFITDLVAPRDGGSA